jgi:NifU-like protein
MMNIDERYTKKMREKIDRPRYAGFFTAREAEEKGMRLVTGRDGMLCLYWLVDEADGVIADAKYQAFGPPALVAVGEIVSELALRKNYDQVSRFSSDLVDQHVREKKEILAFAPDDFSYLNQALSAIDRAVYQCLDIPFAATHDVTPIEQDFGAVPGGIPGWPEFSVEQKRQIIEEVMEKEIRPYIALDAGGVKILSLEEDRKVKIAYEGSCTTCHSSTGSTLNAIQSILRARVHPSLEVIPV